MISSEDRPNNDNEAIPPVEYAQSSVDTTESTPTEPDVLDTVTERDGSTDVHESLAVAQTSSESASEDSHGIRQAVRNMAQQKDQEASQDAPVDIADKSKPKPKKDQDTTPKPRDVPVEGVRKARAVFIPPMHYLQHLQQANSFSQDKRIWVVTGRPQSGKFTCALHLGLALFRQGRPLDRDLYQLASNQDADRRPRGHYTRGIRLLRQRLEHRRGARESSMLRDNILVDLATLEARLLDNLSHIEDENIRSARQAVLIELNLQSLDLFSMSFDDLCRWTDVEGDTPDDTTRLQTLPSVKVLRRDGRDTVSLLDFLQDQNLERQTIYIVERAFESGVSQSELTTTLHASLSSSDSYLILTTELTEQALGQIDVPSISTRFGGAEKELSCFLRAVMQAHVNYYATIDGLPEVLCTQVEQVCDHILEHALRQPFTIDMFCARLRGLPAEADREAVIMLADQVGRIDREATRTWFGALSENERLYTLLAYLFDELDHHLLDNLYTLSVRYLRQDGVVVLRDPRELGMDSIRDRIRAHITESNTVQFNNSALVEEVRRQLRNYHHVLWSLCEHVFGPLIGEYQAFAYAPFRQSLGTAIGRLGMGYEVKLHPLLDELAAHESGGVASTAGYILNGLIHTNPARCGWVTEWIEHWARSQEFNQMWAASAALWRVYDGVVEITRGDYAGAHGRLAGDMLIRLRETLTQLATYPDRFHDAALAQAKAAAHEAVPDPPEANATAQVLAETARNLLFVAQVQGWTASLVDSVIHALAQISRQQVADVVVLVTTWLQEPPSSNQHVVGELAALRLIGNTVERSGSRPVRLIIERHEPLLALVGPMLKADEDAIRTILLALRYWIQQDGWATRVHQALLQTITRASFTERTRLADLIADEWDNDNSVVSVIAQSLITRARLVDGFPADVYQGDSSIILCDSSLLARRQRGIGARLTRLIASDIAVVAPVSTGGLGFALVYPQDGTTPNAGVVLAPTIAPRLVTPVLEALAGPETPLVLVITWGRVLDLEDACASPWADRLLLGTMGAIPDLPENVNQVEVTLPINIRKAADQLITAARIHLVRHLAKRDTADRWKRIIPLLHQETPDLLAIDTQLETWITELDNPPERPDTDPLRAIIATMSWMLAADLPACVERLVRWLSDTDMRHQLAGGATARALFYLMGVTTPTPDVEHSDRLLHLIGPLASQGWASTLAVLFAVRRWVRTQSWIERLLSPADGTPAELLQLVGSLDATDQQRLANLLKTWAIPLPDDDPDHTPARIARVREQIALRVALGSGHSLPALTDGQTYGILIVDTSIARHPLRLNLARVASFAIRELRKRYGSALQVLVFRLGQTTPLTGPTEQPSPDVIAPPDAALPPRLLGPLLDRMPLAQVRFVVLLSPTPASDEEDWYETSWATRIHVYSETDRVTQPFGAIPSQRNPRDGAEAITEYLALRYPRS